MDLKDLEFDEEKHIYKLRGTIIPSVTTVMRPLSNSLYKTVDEKVLNKAAAKGTAVHNAIENLIKFGIDDCPEEYHGYFDAYLAWRNEYNPEILSAEQKVYHKTMLYAGTIDCVCRIGSDKMIVDYKTSYAINGMLTGVQTEAYAKAYETHYDRIDKKAILHLKKDGTYDFVKYKKNDTESWNVFIALLTIHNHIEKHLHQGG